MENEHSELIIGYLQGRLQGRSLDDFYAWVNESADNKKLFFETKALYEACAPSRGASEIHDSWLRLLDKRKSRQRKRYSLLTRISTYAAVAMFAAAITSTVFIFSSREYDDRITSYVGGDGLEADVVVLPDGTRVSLGTRTSFSYDSRYGKSERIVQLEGEAYFEVAKNKAIYCQDQRTIYRSARDEVQRFRLSDRFAPDYDTAGRFCPADHAEPVTSYGLKAERTVCL